MIIFCSRTFQGAQGTQAKACDYRNSIAMMGAIPA